MVRVAVSISIVLLLVGVPGALGQGVRASAADTSVLLVDDDWNFSDIDPASLGGLPYYTAALEALDLSWEVWDVTARGGAPTAADMSGHDVIVWFTGYAWNQGVVTSADEAELAAYLDAGGGLILSSSEYLFDADGVTTFMTGYLGVADANQDVAAQDVRGAVGDPVGDGLGPYTFGRPDAQAVYWPQGDEEGPWTDELTAAEVSSGAPWVWVESGLPSSTWREGGTFRAVFLAWPLEWIADNAERAECLGAMIDWIVGGPTPPLAEFSWTPLSPEAGQTVIFENRSTGSIQTYSWVFGDGGTSAERDPTHVFAAADTYTVTLSVSGGGGSAQVSHDVTVTQQTPFVGPALSLPAVAKAEGQNDSYFYSRVVAFNASNNELRVQVVFTPRLDIDRPVQRTAVTIPARTQISVFDPLTEWFGFGADDQAVGSLMFAVDDKADSNDLMIQSVVFARNPDGSEYGQFFPALRTSWATGESTLTLFHATTDAERTRVNVGVMAVQDNTNASIVPMDPIGTELASARDYVLPHTGDNVQLNDVHSRFQLDPGLEDFMIGVSTNTGAALPYVSVLDGNVSFAGTSDPTTILAPQWDEKITLLELGAVQGIDEYGGSASISSLDEEDITVQASFFSRGVPGNPAEAEILVPARSTLGYDDVVGDLFGLTDVVGTLVLQAPAGKYICATGREFSIFRDDEYEITGTAGQLMAGLIDDALTLPGMTYHLLGLREEESADGQERSNLAFFNPGSEAVTVTVRLFDGATGTAEGSANYTVRASELRQINSIIAKINNNYDTQPKRLEITTTGSVFVNAFRVNQYGDPVTIDPLPEL